MKVALIIERIEVWRGGAETSTMLFAGHLADLGCEVTIITASSAQSTPSLEVVPIHTGGWNRVQKTRRFVERAGQYARERGFDVVHSISPCPSADVYQPRGGTVPEMLERNRALRSRSVQRGLKWLTQRANRKYALLHDLERRTLHHDPPPWVIAISEYVARQLTRHYAFDDDRVARIFNGVDPDLTPDPERLRARQEIRRQFDVGTDDVMALCVAHNFKLKGVPRLVDAIARVRAQAGEDAPRVVAMIVGRDDPTGLAPQVSRHDLESDIIFTGPTQRIRAFFHAADVLVHPTYYDPCSRVVLEALASGLPVITTRFNGAAERITEGREGYVIDTPDDVETLASCIMKLTDASHRKDCARHAVQAVEGISMRDHAANVMTLYERIRSERASR